MKKQRLEVGDEVINEDNLVGTLKRLENEGLYYVEGFHDLAGKWTTGYDHLWKFEQSWRLYRRKRSFKGGSSQNDSH